MNISILINELYKAFNLFNKTYYDGSLPEPSITIQSKGNKKNVMGWCTVNKIWKDISDETSNVKKYEIAIISEYLYRGMLPVLSTLLHEMVHLHCLSNNIKDTSRSGTYHNKTFKKIAEGHGLEIEYDKRIGWSSSKLTTDSIRLVENSTLNSKAFMLYRINPEIQNINDNSDNDDDEKKKSTARKYICPCCHTIIRATKDVNIICADCNVNFELEEN